MSKCNYTAPDGSRSKVGEYLEQEYGETATQYLWNVLNSSGFLSQIVDWKVDQTYNTTAGELQPLKAEEFLVKYGAIPIRRAINSVKAYKQSVDNIADSEYKPINEFKQYFEDPKIYQIARNAGMRIALIPDSENRFGMRYAGLHVNGNTIVIDPKYLTTKVAGTSVIDHEVAHTFTYKVLHSDLNELTPTERTFREGVDKAFEENKPFIFDHYGFTNTDEFVAEFYSNKGFRDLLKNENISLWTRFMKFLNGILKVDNSHLEKLFGDYRDSFLTTPEGFDILQASQTVITQEEIDSAKATALNDLLSAYDFHNEAIPKVVNDAIFAENLARMFAEKRDTEGKVVGYFTDTEQKAAVDSILTDVYSSVRNALANGENLTVGTLLNALKNTRLRIGISTKMLANGDRKTAVQQVVNSFDQLAGFALERLRAYGFNISDKVVSRISEYLKETTPKGDINEITETNDANKDLITNEETQETITGDEARGMKDWNDVTFELNPRDTASKRLKFFLATIIDSELGTEDAPRAVNMHFSDPTTRQEILSGNKRYTTRTANEVNNIKLGPDGRGSVQIEGETFEVRPYAVISEDTDTTKFNSLFDEEGRTPNVGDVVYSIERFNPKSNVPKNKLSYLGFPVLANFETLFEDLLGVLGDTDRSWENFRTLLMTSKRPNMMRVALDLDNSDEQLRNEFVKVMSKQYQPFTMVLFNIKTQRDGSKTMQARPINANRASAGAVILDQWKENQKESPMIVQDDIGRLAVNTALADRFQKTLDSVLNIGLDKLAPENLIKLKNFAREVLSANGINLTDDMFEDLMSNMARLTAKQSFAGDWKSQFRVTKDGKPLGIFSTIIMKLSGRSSEISDETGLDVDADSFLKNNNPLYTENSVMKVLTGVALRYTEKLYSSSHRSSDGKTIYDWGLNTYESHEIRKLKTDKNYLKQMQSVTFAKDSWLLKNLVNDPEARSRLQLGYLDGLKARYRKSDGITRSEMSDREQNLTALAMFQNTGYKYASFIDMTKSDKTTTPVMMNVLKLTLKDGFANQKIIQDAFNDVFKSEFNRIREWSVNKANFNNAQYQKGGGLFYMLTHFNFSEMTKAKNAGIITEAQLASVWNSDGTISTSDDVVTRSETVRKLNVSFVKNLRANTIKDWKRDGIFSDTEHLFDESWVKKANKTLNIHMNKDNDGRSIPIVFEKDQAGTRRPRVMSVQEYNNALAQYAALEYSTNYFLFNTSMAQLISGDPALVYKPTKGGNDLANVISTMKEYQKRLAKDIGPGSDPAWDIHEKYATVTLADFDYKSYLNNFGLTAYAEFDTSTDAQELTTVKEHLAVMYAEGKIPVTTYREMLDIIEAGLSSSSKYYEFTKPEHLSIVMQPHKPVYVGAEISEGVKQIHYVKSSSYPLLPQFTRGLQLDALRQRMEGNSKGEGYIARANFKSAKKIGAPVTPVNIFDGNGNLTPEALNSDTFTGAIQNLTREGFRIQQEVPYDEEKEAIRTVSQMNKLITEGTLTMENFEYRGEKLSGKALRDKKEQIRDQMLEIGKQDFLKKVGAEQTPTGYTFTNLEKFYKALEEEAISRKYPINDIEALRLRGKTEGRTQLVLPLWFNGSADRFESLAMAMVRKIVEVKMPGKSFVQASSSGFKALKAYEQLTEQDKSGITWVSNYDTTRGLRSLDKDESGQTVAAQVLIPFNFFGADGRKLNISDYTGEDGRIDNEKLPVELRQLVGARIPNQGHNSMLPIEIVGFIPDNMGDLMIVPAEITQQMGSDFDVDKLYVYKRAYKQDGNKLVVYNNEDPDRKSDSEMKNLKNQYFDIHWSVLTNPAMFDKILKPLDKPDLKNEKAFAEALDSKKGFSNYFDVQSQLADFQSQKDAKRLVGSSSLSTTFNALIQDKNVRLGRIEFSEDGGPKEVPIYIEFKDEVTGEVLQLHRISGEGIAEYYEKDSPTVSDEPLLRTKHDNITSQQSEFLDHAKNRTIDFLNINNFTYPASSAMSMLETDNGVALSLKYNSRLLQQEIIKEYAREMAMGGDSLSTGNSAGLKEKVIAKLVKKYRENANLQKTDGSSDEVFSVQDLTNLLTTTKKDSEYYQKQLAVLDVFVQLDRVGSKLVDIQGTLNQDTAGAGPSLLYSLKQTDRLKNLLTDDLIQGVNEIAGDFITEDVFVPTTEIGHTYNNTVTVANELLTEILPYDKLGSLFEDVTVFSGATQLSVDRQREVFKELKSFIFSADNLKLAPNTEAERARLLYDTEAGESLAKRVQAAKASWGRDNYLLQRLQTNIAEKVGDESTVQYNASKASTLDDYENIKAWISLLRSEDPIVKKLGEDLVSYVFLTGGNQNAVSFVKFVPIAYLNATPFAENLRILSDTIDLENPVRRLSFLRQYYQHNPERAISLAPDLSQIGPDYTKALEATGVPPEYFNLPVIGVAENIAEELVIRNPDRSEEAVADIYPPFLSLRKDNSTILYQRNDRTASNESVAYTRIDTLGKGQISEYSYDNPAPRSIFVDNRAVVAQPKAIQEVQVQTAHPEAAWPTLSLPKIYEDLGFEEGVTYDHIAEQLKTSPEVNEVHRTVLEIVQPIIDREAGIFNLPDLGLVFMPESDWKTTNSVTHGTYEVVGSTEIRQIAVNPIYNDTLAKLATTIAHESIHAVTSASVAFIQQSGRAEATSKIGAKAVKAYDNLRELHKQLVMTLPPNANLKYAVSSVEEMIAHAFEDKEAQEYFNSVIDPNAPGKTIFEHIADAVTRLIEAISEFIGVPVKENSVLNSVVRESLNLMGYESTSEVIERLPFKYDLGDGKVANSEQREGIDKMLDFVTRRDNQRYFVLSGAGGTGKTTIIKKVVEELVKQGYSPSQIGYSGLTHSAVQSLRDAVNNREYQFSTIHSLLGIKKDEHASMVQGKEVFKPSGMSRVDDLSVIIIDEASMLSDELMEILQKEANKGQRIIFMGDYAQLEPVGQDADSFPFRELLDSPDHSAVLIKNERTSHTDVIDLLEGYRGAVDDLRAGKPVSLLGINPLASRRNSRNINYENGKAFFDAYLENIKGALEDRNPYDVVMIAYRNDRRNQINSAVRRELYGPDAAKFVKGDLLIVNSNYNLTPRQRREFGQNSIFNMQRVIVEQAYPMDIKASVTINDGGLDVSIPVNLPGWQVQVNLGPRNDNKILSAYSADRSDIASVLKMTYDKQNKTVTLASGQMMSYGSYLKFKDAVTDLFLDVDYGYAVTAHKSQGMTYPLVFVEEQDIVSVTAATEKNRIKALYTAFSRTKEHLWIYNSRNPNQVSQETIEATEGAPMERMYQSFFPNQALPIQVTSAAAFDSTKDQIESAFPMIKVEMVAGTGQNAGRAYYHFSEDIKQGKVTSIPGTALTETETALSELEALKSALLEKLVKPTGKVMTVEEKGKYEALKQEILKLENDIEGLKVSRNLEDLESTAYNQLKWIGTLIENPDVTMNEIHTALVVANTWSNVFDEIYGVNFSGELPNSVIRLKGSADLKIKQIMGIAQRYWVDKGNVIDSFDDFKLENLSATAIAANVRDLSKAKSRVGQEAAKLLQESHRMVREEISRMRKRFNKYNDQIQAIAKARNLKVADIYEMFFQKNANGDAWGMVQTYSQDYYDFRKRTRDKLNAMLNLADSAPTTAIRKTMIKNAWDKYQGEVNQNLVFVNTPVFFDKTTGARLTGAAVDAAKEVLVKHVGESAANDMINKAEQKYKDYLDELDSYRLQIKGKANNDLNQFIDEVNTDKTLTVEEKNNRIAEYKTQAMADYNLALNIYENQHSPNSFFNKSARGSNQRFRNYQSIVDAPKRSVMGGIFYDKAYEGVQEDAELAEIYAFIKESMQEFISYLPEHVTRDLGPNFLPIVEAKVGTDFTSLQGFKNSVDEGIKDTFSLTPGYAEYANTTSTKIPIRYVKGGHLNLEDRERNIMVLLEKFGTMAYHYKHFSQVQSAVEVIQQIVNDNIDSTAKGVTKLNNGVKSLSDMIRTAKEVLMYQQPKKAEVNLGRLYSTNPIEQVRISAKVANLERQKSELDDKYALGEIDAEEYNQERTALDLDLSQIEYRDMYASKFGDAAIKLTELKALSYNPFSAIANLSFGLVSVLVHANGRVDFNKSDVMQAFSMMIGATKRAITFGTAESAVAEKILNLMDRLDIMGDLLDSDFGEFTRVKAAKDRWKQFISPYQMLRQSDYFVKGLTIVAMTLQKQVTNPETGEQISLWDALDKDANWKFGENPQWNAEDVTEQTDFRKFQNQAIAVTKVIMGNQDSGSPMMIKRSVIGRLVAQFRASWMAEGAYSRFEDEHWDDQLGRDVKGRYRTYADLGLFGSLLTLGRQALSTLVSIDPFTGKRKDGSAISEVDIENMRKNLAEVAFFMGVAAAVLMLKYMGDDCKDNSTPACMKKKKMMTMLINTLIRNRQDIAFYASPEVFSSVTKNVIPAQKVWVDFERAMSGTARILYNKGFGHNPNDKFGFEQWALRMTKAGIPHPYFGLINKVKTMAEKDLDTFTQ